MSEYVIFFDDGGVINDNGDEGRHAMWNRLLYEFYSPKFGGSMEEWAAANRKTIDIWLAFPDQRQNLYNY